MDRAITVLIDFRFDGCVKANLHLAILDVLHAKVFGRPYAILHSDTSKSVFAFDPVIIVTKTYFGEDDDLMLTLNLDMPKNVFQELNTEFDDSFEESLMHLIKAKIPGCKTANFFPQLKRCMRDPPYAKSSDNRIQEYNISKMVFSKQSEFQLVQIAETLDYGRLLILDGFANLAESDTVAYTHSLMNLPHENYSSKEVLILGGGDGALLKELMELPQGQRPAFITMVDIDDVVMDACNEWMPSVCGEYMLRKNWNSNNYKIIAGCAIEYMKNCVGTGKKFDYIFGDLTDTPVSTKPRDSDVWKFLATILELGMSLLKPNTGRYLTHCNGINVPKSLAAYEAMLSGVAGGKCRFTKTTHYVTSFMETWVYYQIRKVE